MAAKSAARSAKRSARKLKVFQTQLGFYETVVAAPSQAAALRAWGVRQNLFASGQARITDEPDAVKAAVARPETPLKRAVGSNDPFGLVAKLPDLPAAPKRNPTSKSVPGGKLAQDGPPADRSALDAAEDALRKLDDARKREEAEFRRRDNELDAAKAAAQSAYVEARKTATTALVDARKSFRGAGGHD